MHRGSILAFAKHHKRRNRAKKERSRSHDRNTATKRIARCRIAARAARWVALRRLFRLGLGLGVGVGIAIVIVIVIVIVLIVHVRRIGRVGVVVLVGRITLVRLLFELGDRFLVYKSAGAGAFLFAVLVLG